MKHNSELIKFTNLESKLVFEYVLNVNNYGKLSSLTFYHKLANSSCKVDYKLSIYDTINDFIDLIQGKVYGSVMIEKYKNFLNSYTYLMYDGNNYKIGQSIKPNKRLLEFKTGNPTIKLLKQNLYIPEKYFHDLFHDVRTGGEWFKLDFNNTQAVHILFNAENELQGAMLMRFFHKKVKKSIEVKKEQKQKVEYERGFLNYKLSFGKYKGKKLKDMIGAEELRYLVWLYRDSNLNDGLKGTVCLYLNHINKI
jgi:hypothetical protein